MKKLIVLFLIAIMIINSVNAYAAQLADPYFESATATLLSGKSVSIYLETRFIVSRIQINKCWIQKEVDGSWSNQNEFSYQYLYAENTLSYGETINYSSNITCPGKYRIKCTAETCGHTITIYSNSYTF